MLPSGTLQQVRHTCRKLSHFLLPEEVEDILFFFLETRVFIEQSIFDVLIVGLFSSRVIPNSPVGKRTGKHNIKVLLLVV